MAVPLLPDTIDAVANRIAAGDDNATIRGALGLSRNSLAGIISRLRKRGDPRVPAAGASVIGTRPQAPAGGRGWPKSGTRRLLNPPTAFRQRDALAEAFAEGARDLADAAAIAGLNPDNAQLRWREICRDLGSQAR